MGAALQVTLSLAHVLGLEDGGAMTGIEDRGQLTPADRSLLSARGWEPQHPHQSSVPLRWMVPMPKHITPTLDPGLDEFDDIDDESEFFRDICPDRYPYT